MKEREKDKFINFIIIGIILLIMVGLSIDEYKNNKIQEKTSQYTANSISTNQIETENTEEYPKEEIIEEYKGYQVIAKLEIPEIKLETYILRNFSTESLNVSVTKFWGADPNQIGNFCIAGHNFQNKNMFRNLKNLEIGNNIIISDNTVGKINYEIYNIYTVYPSDVSCLSQETNGKREVTLITCTSDSKERIIVKAREKEK